MGCRIIEHQLTNPKPVVRIGSPDSPTGTDTLQVFDAGNGEVYAVFTAVFTPDAQESTGRFAKVTGGSFIMVATTGPFVLGSSSGWTACATATWRPATTC